jgi:hypothetical protein
MLKIDAISSLTKDTEHLPDSSFYLWCADVIVKNAIKEFPKIHKRDKRYKILTEAEKYLKCALSLFAKDKKQYQENQKQWFLERKYYVDKELKALQVKHIKMLITELVVV